MLAAVPGIDDLALTTNGILLEEQAADLRRAGLERLNISLDTLSEETFQKISRREGLDRVLAGIAAAQKVGFKRSASTRSPSTASPKTKSSRSPASPASAASNSASSNTCRSMPSNTGKPTDVLDGDAIRRILEAEFGPLLPVGRPHASQPATDFEFADGRGRIGLIQPVSQPFCGACDRLRLTAEGQVRNCLFSTAEWDARAILRGDGTDDELSRPHPRLHRRQSPRPRHQHHRVRPPRTRDVPNRRLTGRTAVREPAGLASRRVETTKPIRSTARRRANSLQRLRSHPR